MKTISNIKNLISAYELIKSKPGNMTWGTTDETLDGVSLATLTKIQSKLKAGTFRFPPARRIQIPKPGKSKETRPLTIASPRDKIVQKAIQLAVEPLFEESFLDCSHGFRPNKGTRTAMAYIDSKFQSCRYIIEADFSKAFDSIQHKKLVEILKEKITCTKTLSLIHSGLKAGYVEFGKLHENLSVGTPQGSILSPLLCNIYLHKLDLYMEEIKQQYNCGIKHRKNKEYESLSNAAQYRRAKGRKTSEPAKYKALVKKLVSTPSMKYDDKYVRIQYIRYADDFIIGVEGSYQIAKKILDQVESWINDELKLKLNPEKTGISKYSEKSVNFLGYTLRAPHTGGDKPLESLKTGGRTITRRRKLRIRIHMDYPKVLNKLSTKGFIKTRIKHDEHERIIYRGTFRGNLINLDHADILRYYNSVIRGLYNYYNFVGNMKNLARVCWLIEESCCLTLARKFKLKTMAATYRKFGKGFGCLVTQKNGKQKKITLWSPTNFKKQSIQSGDNPNAEPLKGLDAVWNAKFTKSSLHKECIICGKTDDVEMHHIRKIRDLKRPTSKLDFFSRQMAAINRKQIPLCKDHHTRLHSNTWSEAEKAQLKKKKGPMY
jgi:group II intron reverse transcriptase/maturase